MGIPTTRWFVAALTVFAALVSSPCAYSGEVQPWAFIQIGSPRWTYFYPTDDFVRTSEGPETRTLDLPVTVGNSYMTGDVDGNGSIEVVLCVEDPPSLLIVDPLSGDSYTVPLEPNPHIAGTPRVAAVQLIEYDGTPGLEVVCYVIAPDTRPMFQIVSPARGSVLASVIGEGGVDVNGDGTWSGRYESMNAAFRSKAGKWKIIANVSYSRPDLHARALRVYDVDTGKLESQFDVATPTDQTATMTTPSGDTYTVLVPWTPDNEITPGVNVSAMLDGFKTTDRESYVTCFKNEGLALQWYHKRGEFMGGRGFITTDSRGRELAVAFDQLIRAWDPLTPGGIHVYDLFSGRIVREFFLEEGLSFNMAVAAENTDSMYAVLLEEPRMLKFDLYEGQTAELDYTSDPTINLYPYGVTDMDADGEHEVLLRRASSDGSDVMILDADLNEKAVIPAPLAKSAAFADADNDGFPELILLDNETKQSLTIIEYSAPSSHVPGFEGYR